MVEGLKEAPARSAPVWLLPLAVAIVTFAAYVPALGFDFVYDDYAQIVETKQLNSWRTIPHYFTGHVWAWKTPGIPGPYYRPIFLLWLLANQTLFGTTAFWWHLTSVLTHVVATLLVFALAERLTKDRWAGAIAALVFGLHPAHLESVAWVSGITDPLLSVFLLGSLVCYLTPGRKWELASLGLFILALLGKETAVIMPLVICAYAWLFDTDARGSSLSRMKRSTVAAAPYALLIIVYLGVRLRVLHELSMVITPVTLRDMALTWPSMLVFYVRHLIWPAGLSILYSLPVLDHPDAANFFVPCLVLAFIAGALFVWSRRSRVAAFSVVILLLPLLPELNLRTFARVEVVHDRYLYLPSAGFAILAALGIRKIRLGSWNALGQPVAQFVVLLAIAAGMTFGLVDQGQYWSDNINLFLRSVAIAPDNEIANQCLGTALMLRRQIAEAIPYYKHALELNANMPEAQYSLGRCYYELGMFPESEPYFQRAAALRPADAKPYLYFGLAKLKEGQLDMAERALRAAFRVKGHDDYREYHLALGLLLKERGDLNGALHEFQAEANENPDPSQALERIREVKTAIAEKR
jgi:tetratricopeptide (TPR) repeat protein